MPWSTLQDHQVRRCCPAIMRPWCGRLHLSMAMEVRPDPSRGSTSPATCVSKLTAFDRMLGIGRLGGLPVDATPVPIQACSFQNADVLVQRLESEASIATVAATGLLSSVQPALGIFNELALRRLDLILAQARLRGIRVIMVLSNFWSCPRLAALALLGNTADQVPLTPACDWTRRGAFGGMQARTMLRPGRPRAQLTHCLTCTSSQRPAMCGPCGHVSGTRVSRSCAVPNALQWYVDQAVGMGQPLELFYSDARCKDAYKTYVATVTGRTNTVNGIPYASDGAGASRHHPPCMCIRRL